MSWIIDTMMLLDKGSLQVETIGPYGVLEASSHAFRGLVQEAREIGLYNEKFNYVELGPYRIYESLAP